MANGQEWVFADPPGRDDAGAPDHEFAGDPDYLATVAAVAASEDRPDRLRNELALMIDLLTRAYRLAPEDVRALLRFPGDDPGHAELQAASREVAADHVRWFRGRRDAGLPHTPARSQRDRRVNAPVPKPRIQTGT